MEVREELVLVLLGDPTAIVLDPDLKGDKAEVAVFPRILLGGRNHLGAFGSAVLQRHLAGVQLLPKELHEVLLLGGVLQHLDLLHLRLDHYLPILRGELDRVGEEVHNDLDVPVLVPVKLQEVRDVFLLDLVLELYVLLFGKETSILKCVLDQLQHVEVVAVYLERLLIDLSHIQQVIHQIGNHEGTLEGLAD